MNCCEKKIEKFNIPDYDTRFHKLLIEPVSYLMEQYICVQGGGVKLISLSIILNDEPKIIDQVRLRHNVFIYFENTLDSSNVKQDNQNLRLKEGLKRVINDLPSDFFDSINRLSIVIGFNKMPYNNLINQGQVENIPNKKSGSAEASVFHPRAPRFGLNQITLNDEILLDLKQVLSFLESRHIIYEDWGFKDIDPEPKIILNFYGPPGTGKTMTAHAIANEIGSSILDLNYADIESKYVGDAPKNLVEAFAIAKKSKSVLFFDEADSFLGKRISNISSSSDQAVNSLRSQLLILLEEFDGVVIFATNLINNYDKAFHSRIYKHIQFSLPDVDLRIRLIRNLIPKRLKFSDGNNLSHEQLMVLSKCADGFSGRDLKNTILASLIHCHNEGVVSYDNFYNTFQKSRLSKDQVSVASKNGSSSSSDLAGRIKRHISFGAKLKNR